MTPSRCRWERCCLGLDEFVDIDFVGPTLKRFGSLCSCRVHGVHQPFRNWTFAEIRDAADADDRSVSSWIRRAVDHELEHDTKTT